MKRRPSTNLGIPRDELAVARDESRREQELYDIEFLGSLGT
jgi:hypothetical protein